MKIKLSVEIESVGTLKKEEVKKVEGMSEKEALAFLVKDVRDIETYVREGLTLSANDSVQIKLKLEDEERREEFT